MEYYTQKEFEERVVETKRVSKKTKGGNRPGFSALIVVGDKKGRVGVGLGKAPDISVAIQKGIKLAKRDLVEVKIVNGTIPHEVEAKYKSSYVKLMPAPEGSGIIAGGAVRHIVELAGISSISAKLLGSNNKATSIACTLKALKMLKGKN